SGVLRSVVPRAVVLAAAAHRHLLRRRVRAGRELATLAAHAGAGRGILRRRGREANSPEVSERRPAPPSLSFRLRNVLLLILAKALSSPWWPVAPGEGSLAGYALASNKARAPLPSTMSVMGTALTPTPASMLMKRLGRRLGFMVGTLAAMAGGVISVLALAHGSFWLLTAAALLLGVSGAFAPPYPFAAAGTSLPRGPRPPISFRLVRGPAPA